MAEIIKPNMANLWASGGAVVAPSAAKIDLGWTAEIPPHQYQNWHQNRSDSAIGYMFQHGIPEWDSSTEYFSNSSFVQSSGLLYVSITDNSNQNPSTSPAHWRQLPSILASAAEAAAGVDVTKIITPSTLNSLLVGMVAYFPLTSAPAGWIKANGAAVSRAAYSSLFARVGTTSGSGDGSTTFNVPDLRAEFIRGLDDGRGVDVGRVLSSAQLDALQNITGSIGIRTMFDQTPTISESTVPTGAMGYTVQAGAADGRTSATVGTEANATLITFNASLSARTSTETRSRNVALLACIKY